jgi:hypothetical protein
MTPEEAKRWSDFIEQGGVLGLMVLGFSAFAAAIVRKWFAPWYVVELKNEAIAERDARIRKLEAREDQLIVLALKGANTSENVAEALKNLRG